MKVLCRVVALVCLAIAAFSGLLTSSLPFSFGWAGLFFWLLSEFVSA